MCRWRSPLDNVQHLLDRANKKDRFFFIDGDLYDVISFDVQDDPDRLTEYSGEWIGAIRQKLAWKTTQLD